MSKTSVGLTNIEFKRFSQRSWSLVIQLSHGDTADYFMAMQTLLYNLKDDVYLYSVNSPIKLTIGCAGIKSSGVEDVSGKEYRLILGRNEIDFACSFLLNYYVEYQAPVDHIDIDILDYCGLGGDGTLVLKASDFVMPMTSEEARMRLQ